MNCARFHFLELVRFFTDIDYLIDSNMPSLQQPHSLFSARFSLNVGGLRSRMERIFIQDVTVRFHSRGVAISVKALRRNSVFLPRVLVNPGHFEPATEVWIISRDQMKFFGIDPRRIPELLDMA